MCFLFLWHKTRLENSRKLSERSSVLQSSIRARWLSISRKVWNLTVIQYTDIWWPSRPPNWKPPPPAKRHRHTHASTHTQAHTRTLRNMCLQNRTLEEHNGRRKLLWALKWGVADPHSAIFIKASDRAKTALGQYWSRPRLSRNLPHNTQSYTCANAREIHTRTRICLSGNNDQTRTCCRSPSSHYKGHIHRCEDCLIAHFIRSWSLWMETAKAFLKIKKQ